VYILTTNRTASASELVINGLTPYIDVKQVGDDTTGKFQASFLLYDAPAPIFSRSQANLTHTYAMLPLVFKTLNATGNTDFIDGLVPDISLREDFANLGILGAENEPLLAAAIAEIATTRSPNYNFSVLKEVGDSNMGNLLEGVMVVD
jgi:carboxyl-terminal processing protease